MYFRKSFIVIDVKTPPYGFIPLWKGEKDSETGYSYFGARYYDSDISVWLSVDRLADKYPSMSPFMYTAGNPVMLVDPDGREIWIYGDNNIGIKYSAGMKVPDGATKFVSDAITGLNFLHRNPEGDINRVKKISDSEVVVSVRKQASGSSSTYDGPTRELLWDNTKIDIYDEGSQSPIVGLAHEIDHANKSVIGWEKLYEFENKGDTKSKEYSEAVQDAYMASDNPKRELWEKSAIDYENFIGNKTFNGKKLATFNRKMYKPPKSQKDAKTIFSTE